MKTKDRFLHIVPIILLSLAIHPTQKANAAINVHDYISNDNYIYNGTEVNYIVNGQKISADYPGLIMSDGSAIGSFHDIFELPLGVTSSYKEGSNSFSLNYHGTTIQMTLGSKTALVNRKSQLMAQAPVLLSFADRPQKYLYVPTRFVAEALGFTYQWNAAAATSTITRPNAVYDGTSQISYSGLFPSLIVNGAKIGNSSYPGYVFNDTTVLSLKHCFLSAGLCSYDYRPEERLVILTHDKIQIRFVMDSPIAYIGENAYVLSTVPRLISPYGVDTPEIYLPAEFTLKALGYNAKVDDETLDLILNEIISGENTNPDADSQDELFFDKSTYQKELFSYTAHTQLVTYHSSRGYRVPLQIAAYSCKNSDAIYFKGITKEQLKVTDKFDLLEISIPNSFNPFGYSLYYEPENRYLNYFGIKKQDALSITLFKSSDFVFYSYNVANGCILHICSAENSGKDKLTFGKGNNASETSAEIKLPQSTKELLPKVIGDKKAFTIKLPAQISLNDIMDEDDYNNLRFILKIPGNQTDFLSEQEIYNPVNTLKSYTFRYNASENLTYITFNTTKLQGYTFNLEQNILSVKIDDPKKVYDKIIVLDAGHGGIDPGTLRGSTYEKNINFNVINLYAASYFKDSDIKVYYTRTTDTKIALETRAALAAKVGADFFISFHVNSNNNPAASGTSVYYSASNNLPNAAGLTSKILGSTMLNKLIDVMGTRNAGLLTQKFVVIHENTVPAILIEIGFITNDNDFAKLTSSTYQKKAAKAIYDVVNELFATYPTDR